jgi:hypothetical protein
LFHSYEEGKAHITHNYCVTGQNIYKLQFTKENLNLEQAVPLPKISVSEGEMQTAMVSFLRTFISENGNLIKLDGSR